MFKKTELPRGKSSFLLWAAVGLLVVLALVTGGCGSGQVEKGEFIEMKGSDTMVQLGQAWAEAYLADHPESGIAVTGGGSGTGIAALINGTTDIAMASRQLKETELQQARKAGRDPQEFIVGFDGLAVIVHPDNPIDSLTLEQIKDIYTGRVTNWQQLGGVDQEIVVLSRESNSGTYVYFREQVLQEGNYRADALLLPSSTAEVQEVASNPAAIAYLGVAYVNDQVKALGIDTGSQVVLPVHEDILSGAYPIARPLFIYTAHQPEGLVKDFVDFMFSEPGQEIVGQVGYTPVCSDIPGTVDLHAGRCQNY